MTEAVAVEQRIPSVERSHSSYSFISIVRNEHGEELYSCGGYGTYSEASFDAWYYANYPDHWGHRYSELSEGGLGYKAVIATSPDEYKGTDE